MEIFKILLIGLWRIWFYVLMSIPIIVFFPFLLLFTSRTRFYPQFFFIARLWAYFVLYGMGFHPRIKREEHLESSKNYMLVANHTSMCDIMLMLVSVSNPFVFVGKMELAKIPLFGFFYKRTCILVDRGSQKSRNEVFKRAQRRLKDGTSICIFPEGGVPDDLGILLDEFKDGAFRLAIEHQIPVVPVVFFDNKRRFPYVFSKGKPGVMKVLIKKLIPTEGKGQADRRWLKDSTREVILKELENHRSQNLKLKPE